MSEPLLRVSGLKKYFPVFEIVASGDLDNQGIHNVWLPIQTRNNRK